MPASAMIQHWHLAWGPGYSLSRKFRVFPLIASGTCLVRVCATGSGTGSAHDTGSLSPGLTRIIIDSEYYPRRAGLRRRRMPNNFSYSGFTP